MREAPKVYAAISAVQKAMAAEGLAKTRQTQAEGKYKYRGIDDVMNALSSVLAEHKLCIIPRYSQRESVERVSRSGGAVFYTTVIGEFDFVSAEDGTKHTCVTLGEAMDTSDKGTGKAMSYAYRECCVKTFCIPTEGDHDTESASHEVQGKAAQPAHTNGAPAKRIQTDDIAQIRQLLGEMHVQEDKAVMWASRNRTGNVTELTPEEGVMLWNAYREKQQAMAKGGAA